MTIKETILQYIRQNKYFSLDQLVNEKKLGERTVKNYLLEFKNKKVIFDAGYGVYSTIEKEFKLVKNNRVDTIERLLKKSFPFTDFSIWNTHQLQPLYQHTQSHHITFIDVENDAIIGFFERISDKYRDAAVEKGGKSFFANITVNHNPVIVRKLIRRSPKNDQVPLLEKILVDMFLDLDKYKYLSEADYWQIWKTLSDEYRVKIGVVSAYSKRRKCFKRIFSQLIENKIFPIMTFGAYFDKVAKVIMGNHGNST